MTWLIDHLPTGHPVLDASVIINLLGSGEPVAILRGLRHSCLVEQRTLREIRKHPVPGLPVEPVLAELQSSGLLCEVRMTDAEYEAYLRYVSPPLGTRLGDGESAALAIARRGACLVLDERKARKVAASEHPRLPVASSLKLFISSAYRVGWRQPQVMRLVARAQECARMAVPKEEQALLAEVLQSNP